MLQLAKSQDITQIFGNICEYSIVGAKFAPTTTLVFNFYPRTPCDSRRANQSRDHSLVTQPLRATPAAPPRLSTAHSSLLRPKQRFADAALEEGGPPSYGQRYALPAPFLDLAQTPHLLLLRHSRVEQRDRFRVRTKK